jgi:undecaprenyl-phosphate 4-deoxy-4-formamido-L-arabinose transferase
MQDSERKERQGISLTGCDTSWIRPQPAPGSGPRYTEWIRRTCGGTESGQIPSSDPQTRIASAAATRPTLSVVIPVFNEEHTLPELIERCLTTCRGRGNPFEIILVDDGSSDASAQILSSAAEPSEGCIVAVLLNRNYGQHAAVMAGLAESRGDVVVTLDADLQNPPEEIPRLLEKFSEGFDVIGTVRTPRQDSMFRCAASRIVNRAARKATGVMMHDYGCMLRAYSRSVVDAMLQCHERSTFIPVLANSFARKATEIPVQHAPRAGGQSKYSLWKLINLQFDLLTSMTTFPLRLLSVIGGIISLAGMGFGLLLLVMRLAYGARWGAEGVFTLFALLFIFIGAQFVAVGLLGEYIGRIYHDVRARPRYLVHRVVGRNRVHDVGMPSKTDLEIQP